MSIPVIGAGVWQHERGMSTPFPALGLLASLVLVSAAGCGGDTPAEDPGAPRPAGDVLVVDAATPDPTGAADFRIDFGTVEVGQQRADAFLVRNEGPTAITLGPIAMEGPFGSSLAAPVEIPAGGAAAVRVHFTPTEAGQFQTILALAAGDEAVRVRLVGSAEAATAPSCVLSVDERPMRWGDTGVGYDHEQALALANLGDAPCLVELDVEGAGFGVGGQAIAVAPRSVARAAVTWSPTEAGEASGTLHLRAGEAEWDVALAGGAVETCLGTDALALDFGAASPGCTAVERTLAVTNVCAHAIEFLDSRVEAGSEAFGIRERPALPLTLQPGGTTELTIVFVPQEPGLHEATVAVADGTHSLSVALRGEGAFSERETDVYEMHVQSDFGPFNRLYLTRWPADVDGDGSYEDDIEVRVDGEVQEPASAGGSWTYDSGSNAVEFVVGHVPPEGTTTEISYTVTCIAAAP